MLVSSLPYYRNDMTSTRDRGVAITGIGVVSPFGAGRERFWHHVANGCSGVRQITEFDAAASACRVAAPVPPMDAAAAFGGEPTASLGPHADPRRDRKSVV